MVPPRSTEPARRCASSVIDGLDLLKGRCKLLGNARTDLVGLAAHPVDALLHFSKRRGVPPIGVHKLGSDRIEHGLELGAAIVAIAKIERWSTPRRCPALISEFDIFPSRQRDADGSGENAMSARVGTSQAVRTARGKCDRMGRGTNQALGNNRVRPVNAG